MKSPYPDNVRGRQICIAIRKSEVTVYGNRQAFQSLAKWMMWLAKSDPSEHYECHLSWHFQLPSIDTKRSASWALFDKASAAALSPTVKQRRRFDLTFMVVEPCDLKELSKRRRLGLLPDH
jgi:hypothetical protein